MRVSTIFSLLLGFSYCSSGLAAPKKLLEVQESILYQDHCTNSGCDTWLEQKGIPGAGSHFKINTATGKKLFAIDPSNISGGMDEGYGASWEDPDTVGTHTLSIRLVALDTKHRAISVETLEPASNGYSTRFVVLLPTARGYQTLLDDSTPAVGDLMIDFKGELLASSPPLYYHLAYLWAPGSREPSQAELKRAENLVSFMAKQWNLGKGQFVKAPAEALPVYGVILSKEQSFGAVHAEASRIEASIEKATQSNPAGCGDFTQIWSHGFTKLPHDSWFYGKISINRGELESYAEQVQKCLPELKAKIERLL